MKSSRMISKMTIYGVGSMFAYQSLLSLVGNYEIYNNKNLCSDPNKQKNLYLKHKHIAVEQAYRDMGFKGSLYVQFEDKDIARNLSFFTKEGYTAIVCFPKGTTFYSYIDLNADIKSLYVAAGHEAAHAVQYHSMIRAFVFGTLMNINPFLGLSYAMIAPLNQPFEIVADITSAIKLGTAKACSKEYERELYFSPTTSELWYKRLSSTHPTNKDRKEYYDKIAKKFPDRIKLFSAKTDKIIADMTLEEKLSNKLFRN